MGGPWGTVGGSSAAAAQAACRQLGYSRGAARLGYGTAKQVQLTARVLDFVECPASADSLEACSLFKPEWRKDDYDSLNAAYGVLGVACYGACRGEAGGRAGSKRQAGPAGRVGG